MSPTLPLLTGADPVYNLRLIKENTLMKRMLSLLLMGAILLSFSACGSPADRAIQLTADNFEDYFYVNIHMGNPDIREGLTGTAFYYTVNVSFDLKQTATVHDAVIRGRLELTVPHTHPLYSEAILPLDFEAYVAGNGHGETDLHYHHGTGSYGGYSYEDFYIVAESVSGSLMPG